MALLFINMPWHTLGITCNNGQWLWLKWYLLKVFGLIWNRKITMPMAAQAVILGGNVRVGLEDNLYLKEFCIKCTVSWKARCIAEDMGAYFIPEQREKLKLKNILIWKILLSLELVLVRLDTWFLANGIKVKHLIKNRQINFLKAEIARTNNYKKII